MCISIYPVLPQPPYLSRGKASRIKMNKKIARCRVLIEEYAEKKKYT